MISIKQNERVSEGDYIYLQVSASEHALIEDQSLRNKVGLCEFYVRIAVV